MKSSSYLTGRKTETLPQPQSQERSDTRGPGRDNLQPDSRSRGHMPGQLEKGINSNKTAPVESISLKELEGKLANKEIDTRPAHEQQCVRFQGLSKARRSN